MKISYNWLKEFVEFDASPEKLAEDLSLFGHEADIVRPEHRRGIQSDDVILDFEITPNRGDCLSILGMAREIAALYNSKVKMQKTKIEKSKLDKSLDVKIEKSEICPRFTARIIENIKIGKSSQEIQAKLATYGFRPVNNIVDITNYVMVAQGQPLHAFDYDKIKNGQMSIRLTKKGEEVMTLDGKNHLLPDGAIIIEDEEKIYDLAGIMGGFKSEVDEKTKTIVLVGAIYDPVMIRKASKYLNHTTDASYRYERGVDFEGTINGVDMAARLILESCPEAKAGTIIDQINLPQKIQAIDFRIEDVNKLLGIDIDSQKAQGFLEQLNIKVDGQAATPPSYRAYDIKIWQDIAEEIARVYGYNNIEKKYLDKGSSKPNKEFIFREAVKDFLSEIGFTEIYSYSFTDPKLVELLDGKTEELLEIEKPLSLETQYLRPNLLGALITQIAKNPWAPEVNVFEIEKVFDKENEWWQMCLASTGKNEFRLEKALKELKIKTEILSVKQKVLDYLKIRRPIKYVLINLNDIEINDWHYKNEISKAKYRPISKYPPTVRDLSIVFDSKANEDGIIETIKSVDKKILITELFDVYHMDNNKKSLAFHIWMQDTDGPMDEKVLDDIVKKVIKTIEDKFQAKIRS